MAKNTPKVCQVLPPRTLEVLLSAMAVPALPCQLAKWQSSANNTILTTLLECGHFNKFSPDLDSLWEHGVLSSVSELLSL